MVLQKSARSREPGFEFGGEDFRDAGFCGGQGFLVLIQRA